MKWLKKSHVLSFGRDPARCSVHHVSCQQTCTPQSPCTVDLYAHDACFGESSTNCAFGSHNYAMRVDTPSSKGIVASPVESLWIEFRTVLPSGFEDLQNGVQLVWGTTNEQSTIYGPTQYLDYVSTTETLKDAQLKLKHYFVYDLDNVGAVIHVTDVVRTGPPSQHYARVELYFTDQIASDFDYALHGSLIKRNLNADSDVHCGDSKRELQVATGKAFEVFHLFARRQATVRIDVTGASCIGVQELEPLAGLYVYGSYPLIYELDPLVDPRADAIGYIPLTCDVTLTASATAVLNRFVPVSVHSSSPSYRDFSQSNYVVLYKGATLSQLNVQVSIDESDECFTPCRIIQARNAPGGGSGNYTLVSEDYDSFPTFIKGQYRLEVLDGRWKLIANTNVLLEQDALIPTPLFPHVTSGLLNPLELSCMERTASIGRKVSIAPTVDPTSDSPTSVKPTKEPTTAVPTREPTVATANPTHQPSRPPTKLPTMLTIPPVTPTTQTPTSRSPTSFPTGDPTTVTRTKEPTVATTVQPTSLPTFDPSQRPTRLPTNSTFSPTPEPLTQAPALIPSAMPTETSATNTPSMLPTPLSTAIPSSGRPTRYPSEYPTSFPTRLPSDFPTAVPTIRPSPSISSSSAPSLNPTSSNSPTSMTVESSVPTAEPTIERTPIPSTQAAFENSTAQAFGTPSIDGGALVASSLTVSLLGLGILLVVLQRRKQRARRVTDSSQAELSAKLRSANKEILPFVSQHGNGMEVEKGPGEEHDCVLMKAETQLTMPSFPPERKVQHETEKDTEEHVHEIEVETEMEQTVAKALITPPPARREIISVKQGEVVPRQATMQINGVARTTHSQVYVGAVEKVKNHDRAEQKSRERTVPTPPMAPLTRKETEYETTRGADQGHKGKIELTVCSLVVGRHKACLKWGNAAREDSIAHLEYPASAYIPNYKFQRNYEEVLSTSCSPRSKEVMVSLVRLFRLGHQAKGVVTISWGLFNWFKVYTMTSHNRITEHSESDKIECFGISAVVVIPESLTALDGVVVYSKQAFLRIGRQYGVGENMYLS